MIGFRRLIGIALIANLIALASAAQVTVVPTPAWCGGVSTSHGLWQTAQAVCDARDAETNGKR